MLKFILPLFLFTFMVCFSEKGFSQKDTVQFQQDSVMIIHDCPDTRLHRWCGPRFARSENSMGIVPSIQGVHQLYLGLGISKAQFHSGEGGGNGFGTTLGVDYNPIDNIIAPKLTLWANGFAFFLGGNIGVSGFYYMKDQASNFVVRPEIGIGYLKLFFNYGYNLFLNNDFGEVSQHTLTLSYYYTFLPFKKSRKKR